MAKHEGGQGAPKKKVASPSTQRYLDIAEIREDAVIMRDGTLRAVLAVSSTNFALKSDDEQQALIAQYVQFLNALDFPIQIVIQSRKLDIDEYIDKLSTREREQSNELLKAQMADYRTYITELVSLGDIMTKSFYVIVPYSPISDTQKSFFSRLGEAFTPVKLVRLKGAKFAERREELLQRTGHVEGSLKSLGLQSVLLDTQALIELFYRLYNPIVSKGQKMVGVESLQVEA